MGLPIQQQKDLEKFYENEDPWMYNSTPDDKARKERLLSFLPNQRFPRVLDIGCGNGFVTFDLPGERVWGVDISKNAIAWAKEKAKIMQDSKRYEFLNASLFDIPQINIGLFDLIVITGVLYSQYIGNSRILSNMIIDSILNKGGILVSCHIEDWSTGRFPYSTIDTSVYKYREYFHKLEVYKK